jgi:hypothetical protein
LSPSEQSLALNAMALWSQVANITFSAAASANINFNHNGNMTASTGGSWIGSQMLSATVDISSNWITNDGGAMDGRTGIYSYGFQTYIHEIGHALGLGHQGPYNGSATYGTDNIYANDTWQYSVMSYFSQPHYNGGSYDYVITPEMADIAAVQSIYGAAATRAGNTVYGFGSTAGSIYDFTQYTAYGTPAFTIYDSGGTDTLNCAGYTQGQLIDLRPGQFSSIGGFSHNIGIYTTTIIETAVGGSGNDTIIGNAANNTYIGNGGNDTIIGGSGINTSVYGGLRSQYQVTDNGNGSIHIFDLRGNAPDGADDVSNVQYFQFADGTVVATSLINHAPVVTVSNAIVNASSTQPILVSALFSANDADSDPLSYLFYDSTVGGGHFFVNGTQQAEGNGQYFTVSAAQLSQVTFVPVAGSSDDLLFGASDGRAFSGWSNEHINGPVNHAPVVTVSNATVNASSTQPIQVSSLFSASDLDGNPLSHLFYDSTVGGGHFFVNGTQQAESNGQYFTVSAAQLSQVTFVPVAGSSDDLLFGASDGMSFSGWASEHINGPVNHAPVATVANAIVNASSTQPIQVSTLFSASDSDGNSLSYLFYDSTVGGGHFFVNGTQQAEGNGQYFTVSAAQLSQVTFVPVAGSSDNLLFGASDGMVFSGWSSEQINGPVNHAPVVTVNSANVNASTGQVIAASSLFSASDADNDALTYLFYDSTVGGGHFEVNGTAQQQGNGQYFGLAASQLSQITFVAGASPGDDVLIGASDGHAFSGWSLLHIV